MQGKREGRPFTNLVTSPRQVALFVPNIIGYTRLALALLSFAVAHSRPTLFLLLYTTSFVLDAVDGMAARALKQCSHFGTILDMLTDRASTVGLLVVLVGVMHATTSSSSSSMMMRTWTRKQAWLPCSDAALATLGVLDVGSHFCRMYTTLFIAKQSHKDVSDSIFALLRHYYSNRRMMGVLCIGQEFALLFLYGHFAYAQRHPIAHWLCGAGFIACLGPCLLKQLVNVQQLVDGLYHLAAHDVRERAASKAGW